ncbi:MAG: hypothetical protein ACRC2K_07765 [Clostridium sp.]
MASKSVKKLKEMDKTSPLTAKKTDYNIPIFGIRSALTILGFAVLGTYLFPFLLSMLGASKEMGVVIGNMLITPIGIAISRCFIETKQGFNKKFFAIYAGFGVVFVLISSYWMYKGIYL